jgi:hypothetical protein
MDTGMSAKDAGTFLAQKQQQYKGDTSVYTATEKRAQGIKTGLKEITKDINTLVPILDSFGRSTPQFINVPLNEARRRMSSPELGQLDLVTKTVALKYERALQGGLLSTAQLHTGAAEDSKRLLSGDMSVNEIKAKLPLMIREINNSLESANESKSDILPSANKPFKITNASQYNALPSGATYTDPNGNLRVKP